MFIMPAGIAEEAPTMEDSAGQGSYEVRSNMQAVPFGNLF